MAVSAHFGRTVIFVYWVFSAFRIVPKLGTINFKNFFHQTHALQCGRKYLKIHLNGHEKIPLSNLERRI